MSARRAGTVAVASVVGAALLVVVLASWASTIGPGGVLRGDGPPRAEATTTAPTASPSPGPTGPPPVPPTGTPATAGWVKVLALLINITVAVGVVYLALRFLLLPLVGAVRRRRRGRRPGGPSAVGPEFEVLEPPDAVSREILADAGEQRRLLLETGSPRNAVVECWHRFETQGAAAGVRRRPWETSSEYTMRVLDLADADQPAVSRLGELYREARFSAHEATEGHRREALEALDAIHRTIGVHA